MIILLILLQSVLPEYSLTADPIQLAYLYEHFDEDLQIPVTVYQDTLVCQGTLGFRGGTSLWLEKKSFHIRLSEDESFPCGGHILLNAQFRDPSVMRNTLGLLLTRKLGFPAPETEFVTLSINGTKMGVYERVERIDRLFYQRNGTGFGPLYKSIDVAGRLVCHYSDTLGITGFEPRVDSEPYSQLLLQLIEDAFRGDVSSLETQEFIGLFAVNTAISDRDGIIKNVYLHLWQDRWHIYPWDRDATFGNAWTGEYLPDWVEKHSLGDIGYFGAGRALLESWDNVQFLNDQIAECALVMGDEYPGIIDSIRLHIRSALAEDPYYEYSVLQFDSICTVLSEDIEARASFLSEMYLDYPAAPIESFEISSCLDLQNTIEVELELEGGEASGVVLLLSFDGKNEEWHYMFESDDDEYEYTFDVPPGTYSVRMAFGPRIEPCYFPVYYPSWSFRGYESRPVPAPGARKALAPLVPYLFSPGTPLWCGENLWILPVTNSADFVQDLSLCSFHLGTPSGTVFFPESVLIEPSETVYLTNDALLAGELVSERVFGDAGTPYPAGTPLVLNDPSWQAMHTWSIGSGDTLAQQDPLIIPSEICRGNGDDWIELFNSGREEIDLAGWILMDSNMNTSVFEPGTILLPGCFLVVCSNSEQVFPGLEPAFLDFSLCSESDSLLLFSKTGDRIFSLGWDCSWPGAATGFMYLMSPHSPVTSPYSWISAEPPGTPGEPNPGWPSNPSFTRVRLASPNPCTGSFSFFYETSSTPLEAILYDMCGRIVSRIDLPSTATGTVSADFTGTLPSGVYILYLRSSTDSDSVRLTVLQEDQ